MPRRAAAGRRPIEPDALHNSKLVQQVINKVMVDGKKSTAEQIVYEALETLSRRWRANSTSQRTASVRARRAGTSTGTW
jgi:small subunit ribosomal protein S7